jgi:hypothetical protein
MHVADAVLMLCCAVMPQVVELQALRQQLEPEVDIPQLQPLRDEVERLGQLLESLQQLQVSQLVRPPACTDCI